MRDPPKTRASRLRRRARSGHGDAEVLDFKADAAVPDLEAGEHVGQVPARVEALRPARAIAPDRVVDEVAEAEGPRGEVLLRQVRDAWLAAVHPVPDAELLAADHDAPVR